MDTDLGEVFRYELTVKRADTGLENTIIVYATSEVEALTKTEVAKESCLRIERKHVTETQSNHS